MIFSMEQKNEMTVTPTMEMDAPVIAPLLNLIMSEQVEAPPLQILVSNAQSAINQMTQLIQLFECLSVEMD